MTHTALHFAAAALSDRGRKRAKNEDAFGYSAEHGVYVVCDGMGGAAGGEVASTLAVDEMLRGFAERGALSGVRRAAEDAAVAANNVVFTRAQRYPALSGMGTTLVALVVKQNAAWVLNVGDSRCYRLRCGRLEQLTHDHSLVDEQVRMGRITPEEALRSPLRNVITRAVGTQEAITPDCFEFQVDPGDLFLLCSDGLIRELTDAEIEVLLQEGGSLEERVQRLVNAANAAGGRDNITCILVQAFA
ncbi:MAG TPA: Stp1/IreP family PP2C-type Ser/Thr phosphatase [Candidatus Saccharimonadales bacterium]|nr:Stp1/IreP family PP2C-type Ser/Thr phosphatase [Candidatus Saccharimonadales bacterium]